MRGRVASYTEKEIQKRDLHIGRLCALLHRGPVNGHTGRSLYCKQDSAWAS